MTDEGLDVWCEADEFYDMKIDDVTTLNGYEDLEATILEYERKYPVMGDKFLCVEFKVEKFAR